MKRIKIKKKKHLQKASAPFGSPDKARTCDIMINNHASVCGTRKTSGIRRSVSPTAALRRSPFLCHRQRELSSPPTELSRNIAVQMLVWIVRSSIRNSTRECKCCFGSPNRARTCDIMINSHALYRLSYRGIL